MSSTIDLLKRLADEKALQHRLDSSLGSKRGGICVLFFHRDKCYSASVLDCSVDTPVSVGCVAKSMTAILIAIAQQEGKLRLDDSVADHLGQCVSDAALRSHLQVTRLYHLLNHSNGLDQSLLDKAQVLPNGCIDADSMVNLLERSGVLAPPGVLFNYSNVGAWVAGAILERAYGCTYVEILESKLLRPLAIDRPDAKTATWVCPSIGGGLRLSARQLMEIARFHRSECADAGLREQLMAMRQQYSVPMPQWPPSGERMSAGWIDFGENFGQLGVGSEGTAAFRFFPALDAAVVTTSTHPYMANLALGFLFMGVLADFGNFRPAKLLSAEQWASTDPVCYAGTFENGKYRLLVDVVNGHLRGKIFRKGRDGRIEDSEPHIKRFFRAAVHDIFVPTQPDASVLKTMQFLHRGDRGEFKFVNTGGYAFARCATG